MISSFLDLFSGKCPTWVQSCKEGERAAKLIRKKPVRKDSNFWVMPDFWLWCEAGKDTVIFITELMWGHCLLSLPRSARDLRTRLEHVSGNRLWGRLPGGPKNTPLLISVSPWCDTTEGLTMTSIRLARSQVCGALPWLLTGVGRDSVPWMASILDR